MLHSYELDEWPGRGKGSWGVDRCLCLFRSLDDVTSIFLLVVMAIFTPRATARMAITLTLRRVTHLPFVLNAEANKARLFFGGGETHKSNRLS
jgi:hypothetical protein